MNSYTIGKIRWIDEDFSDNQIFRSKPETLFKINTSSKSCNVTINVSSNDHQPFST